MPSKQITDKAKSARAVASAADTHAAHAASALDPMLAPFLKRGEKMPDVALLCSLVARRITAKAHVMMEADQAHETELGDDKAPREQRDRAAEELGAIIADLRDALLVTYGPAPVHRFGLDGKLPTDPSVMAALGSSVLARIESGEVKLEAPRRKKGLAIDLGAFAHEIRTHLPTLQKALADVAREEKEANATLHAKQAAVAEHDDAFTTGADFLSATFAMAGLHDLARKVRPSRRHPGRIDEPGDEEQPGGGGATA